MYDELLNDLDICSRADVCTGCSQEGLGGVPECYQIVMERAAKALRERLQAEKNMIERDELMAALGVQMRKTMTENEGYVHGMIAASNIIMMFPESGEGQHEH